LTADAAISGTRHKTLSHTGMIHIIARKRPLKIEPCATAAMTLCLCRRRSAKIRRCWNASDPGSASAELT
jgi:hypothetical protein